MPIPFPTWLDQIRQHAEHFSVSGLQGLLDFWRLTNRLGEMLSHATIKAEDLKAFLDGRFVLLPTSMTLRGRTYEFLSYLRDGETNIPGQTMVARAEEMLANLGEDEGRHILECQGDIPVELRKMIFDFPAWRHPKNPSLVAFVGWNGHYWTQLWLSLDDGIWEGRSHLLRRVNSTALPTTMTLGDRTYDILSYFRDGETSETMIVPAEEMSANSAMEDCQFVLEHQDQIPVALRDKVIFVFPDWQCPGNYRCAAYVFWHYGLWIQGWYWLGYSRDGRERLLRRK